MPTPATERQCGKMFAMVCGRRPCLNGGQGHTSPSGAAGPDGARPHDCVHTLEKPRCLGRGFSLFLPLARVARQPLSGLGQFSRLGAERWGRVSRNRASLLPFLKESRSYGSQETL